MRKMKFTSWGMACLLGGCLSLVSCQQEELGGVPVAKGTGTITLELNAQPGFASGSKTKAVDEAAYKDKMNIRCGSFRAIILRVSTCLRTGQFR